MPNDEARTDAERIELGCDPLQGEQLHDRDDLWRVLVRLGHEPSDKLPTTVWDSVDWSCPSDDCDGGLELIDTRVRGLPADSDALDESVDLDDPEAYVRLTEAQSPTVPVVVCYDCRSAFEVSFRRLRDPEEYSLPEPRIVETPDMLHGAPRIDGTRIGVEHVMAFYKQGYTPEEITLEVYPQLSEEHVREAVEWAEEHPERMAELRREKEELRLRHDILQSAVDAAVAEKLDKLWPVMVNVRSREDANALQPLASLLRGGFERADGLDINIDTDERRVVIDVADEVVARLNDDIDASLSNELEPATANREDWSDYTPTDAGEALFGGDINERVEAEWIEETTPFERVRSVMARTYEPQSAEEIAERARTTDEEARKHLRQLADVGYVEMTDDSNESETLYRRSEESDILERARHILTEVDPKTLEKRVEEIEEDLQLYREQFDADSPETAMAADADVNDEALREWKTTRQNLGVAKVALAVNEATEVIHSG